MDEPTLVQTFMDAFYKTDEKIGKSKRNMAVPKLVQTSMDAFPRYKTVEERLQATVDALNATGQTLPCYVCNRQILTDLD